MKEANGIPIVEWDCQYCGKLNREEGVFLEDMQDTKEKCVFCKKKSIIKNAF